MNYDRQSRSLFIILSISLLVFNLAYGSRNTTDIKSLISQLAEGNFKSRINAARQLGKLGDKRAVEPLIACLDDTNPILRQTAVEALGQIGDRRAVEPLITCLNDNDISLHSIAIKALDKIGDKRAVGPLSEFLNKTHNIPPNCEAALETLGRLGDPNAVDAIMRYLQSDHVFRPTGKIAVETMIKLDNRKGAANLVELWKDSDSHSRNWLSDELVSVGKPVVGPLIELINELNMQTNPDTRFERLTHEKMEQRQLYADTIKVLSEIGDPAAVEIFIMNLESDDMSTENIADKGLRKLGTAAVEPLIDYLEKKIPEGSRFRISKTRKTVIEILGELGDPRAVDVLIRCMNTDDYSDRKAAARALGQIGDRRAIPHLKKLLEESSLDIRKVAADALANLNYESKNQNENIELLIAQQNFSQLAQLGEPAIEPLIKCLNNRNYDIASSARDALVEIGPPAVEPLIAYIKGKSPAEKNTQSETQIARRRRPRRSSRRSSQRLQPTEQQTSLSQIPFSRLGYAAEALGRIGDPRAVEPLLKCMKNSSHPAIATALGRLGDSRAVEPLLARLDETRFGAASALTLTRLSGKKSLEHIVPLLPQWGAYNELISAISMLGWQPQTEAEYVYFWAATDNKNQLLTNWEKTKKILLPDLKNEYRNERALRVFMKLKKDDPALIRSLLSLIAKSKIEWPAGVYLNCGHTRLENAAIDWYKRNNYDVIYIRSENGILTNYDNIPDAIYWETHREHTWQK